MSQLKPSYVKEIQDALSNSCFTLQDFDLELPESGTVLFKVTFLHHDNYSYTVNHEDWGDKRLYASVRPSNYKKEAEWNLKGFNAAIENISSWCKNIRDDLYTLAPNRDPLEALRREFESQIDSLVENPEEHFSFEELESVNNKFDDLYEKFENLKDEYELNKRQLHDIKKQFDEFKSSAEAYPKGVWAKLTNNKLVDIVGTVFSSKEGRQFILGELKKLIGN